VKFEIKLEVPNWHFKNETWNQNLWLQNGSQLKNMSKGTEIIPLERIQSFIFLIRGEKF